MEVAMVWKALAVVLFVLGGHKLLRAVSSVGFPETHWFWSWCVSGTMVFIVGLFSLAGVVDEKRGPLGMMVLAVYLFGWCVAKSLAIEEDEGTRSRATTPCVGWVFSCGRCRFMTDYIAKKDKPYGWLCHRLGLVHFWGGFAVRNPKMDIGNGGVVESKLAVKAASITSPYEFWGDVAETVKGFKGAVRKTGISSCTRVDDYQSTLEGLYNWQDTGTVAVAVQDVAVRPPRNKICAPPRVTMRRP